MSKITIPAPFSFAPSQSWYGNDGSWSSFIVRIGTPPQDFEVFPSTAGQETIIPVPQGCTSSDPSNCGSSRGVLPYLGTQGTGFMVNESSTWDLQGIFTSNLEDTLGYAVNAEYGFDIVGLEVENSGGLTLNHSIVAGIADKSFFVGLFGLGPKPSNFTTFADPQPSFMKTLNETGKIPSLAYGYTAGAAYRESKVLASLTLGGYDSSRFEPTELVIPFASDDSRPLQVAIQTVVGESTLSGTSSLLPKPIYANIDTTLPYLWLPQEACDNFENAFGLTFDNTTGLYLVNRTMHTQLTQLNPSVTFKLGSTQYGGTTQNIILPYGAFDLEASYPIYTNATKYFPIRRAANDTQYTLGRAFMQEAYIIADYERNNFSVAQANFSATMPSGNIVSIISPGYNLTKSDKPSNHKHRSGVSSGAIAGIVVGVVLGIALIILGTIMYLRRRRRLAQGHPVPTNDPDSVGLKENLGSGGDSSELAGEGAKHELADTNNRPNELQGEGPNKWVGHGLQELHSDSHGSEMDGKPLNKPPNWIHEAEGSPGLVYELAGHETER